MIYDAIFRSAYGPPPETISRFRFTLVIGVRANREFVPASTRPTAPSFTFSRLFSTTER